MNTMIKLRNIKIDNNIIEADVDIVATDKQTFKIEVDVKKQVIVKCTRKDDMFVFQALAKLVKLYEENGNKLPSKSESIWY